MKALATVTSRCVLTSGVLATTMWTALTFVQVCKATEKRNKPRKPQASSVRNLWNSFCSKFDGKGSIASNWINRLAVWNRWDAYFLRSSFKTKKNNYDLEWFPTFSHSFWPIVRCSLNRASVRNEMKRGRIRMRERESQTSAMAVKIKKIF